jgi:hypothetical protein
MTKSKVVNITFTYIISIPMQRFVFHYIGQVNRIRHVNIFDLHGKGKEYYVVYISKYLGNLEDAENMIMELLAISVFN